MQTHNNATRLRREVLIRLARAHMEGNLVAGVERIPYEMRPKNGESFRCCLYKDRAVLRYRCMAGLGAAVEDEVDDFTPLSTYAEAALERKQPSGNILTVLDIACKGCVDSRYLVTEACQGCTARSCMENCPFGAIHFDNGRSHIDSGKCRNCGKCAKSCPYHVITHIPVPCEEACPVDAIKKNAGGKAEIDFEACIGCGRCMRNCPFGAVMERSQMIDVLERMQQDRPVVAMLAPSVAGQFPGRLEQIMEALVKLGFSSVIEVALGADLTAQHEAAEHAEKMAEGQAFLTTSCCPAYVQAVRKHLPELEDYVSSTPSPMHYTASLVKAEQSDAVTVFIGPCVAKRQEGMADPEISYVLTFEELGAMLVAAGIEVEACTGLIPSTLPSAEARGFAVAGGVAAAVASLTTVNAVQMDGLDSKKMKILKAYARGKCPGNLLEVMACEGGCVGGAAVVGNIRVSTQAVAEWAMGLPKTGS